MLANNGHVATWCYKCSHCRTKVPRKLRLKHCRWRKQKQKYISLSLSCTQYQTSIAVILKHVVVSMKAKYKYSTWNIHDMKRMCVFSRHAVANVLLQWLHLLGFSPPSAHLYRKQGKRKLVPKQQLTSAVRAQTDSSETYRSETERILETKQNCLSSNRCRWKCWKGDRKMNS